MTELRCGTDPAQAAQRIRHRLAAGRDPSDATPEIAAHLAAAEDPWPAATEVDTSAGPAEALTRAKALFGSGRPAQPAALTDTDTWRP